MASNSIDGGGEGPGDWDRFANVSARRRRVVDATETAPHQPPYGDDWALATFGADPYNGPVGTQDARHRMGSLPAEIYKKHK